MHASHECVIARLNFRDGLRWECGASRADSDTSVEVRT